ncbi:hypothetical protein ALC57_00833 [Trachymyrmex cornetzi]|uniref:Uncharacterized protein n=1 Tax=Trachymyrmex cornetzi TaxID=471704 RepID=A0A195EN24_9HYME|nr:hypothetical protein ALC57_00833 [Trachymyrmex cornetzi]
MSVAKEWGSVSRVHVVRYSTRPDYIGFNGSVESGALALRRLSLPSLAALYTTLLKSIFTYSDLDHVAPRPPRPPLRLRAEYTRIPSSTFQPRTDDRLRSGLRVALPPLPTQW